MALFKKISSSRIDPTDVVDKSLQYLQDAGKAVGDGILTKAKMRADEIALNKQLKTNIALTQLKEAGANSRNAATNSTSRANALTREEGATSRNNASITARSKEGTLDRELRREENSSNDAYKEKALAETIRSHRTSEAVNRAKIGSIRALKKQAAREKEEATAKAYKIKSDLYNYNIASSGFLSTLANPKSTPEQIAEANQGIQAVQANAAATGNFNIASSLMDATRTANGSRYSVNAMKELKAEEANNEAQRKASADYETRLKDTISTLKEMSKQKDFKDNSDSIQKIKNRRLTAERYLKN